MFELKAGEKINLITSICPLVILKDFLEVRFCEFDYENITHDNHTHVIPFYEVSQ